MGVSIGKINVKIMELFSGTFKKMVSQKLGVYFTDFEKFMIVVFTKRLIENIQPRSGFKRMEKKIKLIAWFSQFLRKGIYRGD